MLDIKAVIKQAETEVREEEVKKAVVALKTKLRELASARAVVANVEREVNDLKASIGDGSFVA